MNLEIMEDESNLLMIDVFEDGVVNESVESINNIYRPVTGGTELHRAIRSGDKSRIQGLLDVYQTDLNKIRDYLELKYGWSSEDRLWLKKHILVAVSEEQCRSVKRLEKVSTNIQNPEKSIFVLLLNSIDGEDVAVLYPTKSNQLELFTILWKLLPNGLLTWNIAGFNRESQTFVEAAAAQGNNNAICRLLKLGAPISPPEHNPLLAACSKLRKSTIEYLLENHFTDFDCTQRNGHLNAFMILVQKNHIDILDFVLNKMILYRQMHFRESKAQAFNSIFQFKNDEYPSMPSLSYLRPGTKMRSKIESYIAEYELDVSYQLRDVSMVGILISHKLAVEYCKTKIQQYPELLGFKMHGKSNVLHQCLIKKMFDFLKFMYVRYPVVKRFFETDYGVSFFREALVNNLEDCVAFILENHKEYLCDDHEKLQDALLNIHYPSHFYESKGTFLLKHFPVLKEQIEAEIGKEHDARITEDLEAEFFEITENLKNDPSAVILFKHVLQNTKGPTGETVLHYSVQTDNLTLFEKLLEVGCDLNNLDKDGNHIIHYVRSIPMLELIIMNHPDGRNLVHRTNFSGYTLLHKVCSLRMDIQSLLGLLELVIEYGADVNHLTSRGESAVYFITHPSLLNVLMHHNVKLDLVNNEGQTALQQHLYYQNFSMARSLFPLLHQLPSFNEHAHKYLAPLVSLKCYIFEHYFRSFLEYNDVTTKLIFDSVYKHSRYEASQLFTYACCKGRIFFVKKFLQFDYDLDYNLRDEYGYNPIMGLLSRFKEALGDSLHRLLSKNIDLDCRNYAGQSVLMMLVSRFESARWCGFGLHTVQALIDHGAVVNATDNEGNTALHLAFQRSEWPLIEVLIQNGGALTARNQDGQMPYEKGNVLNREIFNFMT